MTTSDLSVLPTWELLLKRMLWKQMESWQGLRILDFGSGEGWTAAYLARCNAVTAVEPSPDILSRRVTEPAYVQLQGGAELLADMPAGSFDAIVCHNVLEYVEDQPTVLRALVRLLKPGGRLSLLKHNRPGRVMQMAVLLNDFDHAYGLLEGENGSSAQFGPIRYYEDEDAVRWCPELQPETVCGLRTFWHLQQNQQMQKDPAWQARMLALEERVSTLPEYQAVAFFHHLLLQKTTLK